MKVLISRSSLFDGLQRVISVVPQKPTLPVLTNFLIRAGEGKMSISGTDMDVAITTSIDCSVEGEGTVTVNAKRFMDIIRELPDGNVNLTIEYERFTIDFKQGESSIMGGSSEGYPAIKESIDGVSVTLSGSDFVKMSEKTSYSVSVDRTRLALTGVYFKVSPEDVIMVATDGHRLSLYEQKMNIDTDNEIEVIIPPKTLHHVTRIYSSGVDIKKIVVAEGTILFDLDNTVVFSKLIEGPYPNFWKVIPVDNSKKIIVPKEEFAAAVRRVSVLSNSITHLLNFSVSTGSLELTTANADIGGEAREGISITYDGESINAGYNSYFISDILKKIDTDDVLFEMESATDPCIIKPCEKDEESEESVQTETHKETDKYFFLIMPLRLGD